MDGRCAGVHGWSGHLTSCPLERVAIRMHVPIVVRLCVWVGGAAISRIMHIISAPTRNTHRAAHYPSLPASRFPPQFQNIIIVINSIFNFSYNLNPFYSLPFASQTPPRQNQRFQCSLIPTATSATHMLLLSFARATVVFRVVFGDGRHLGKML